LVLLGAALSLFGLDTYSFADAGSTVLITGAIAILVVLLFPHFFTPLLLVIGRLIGRIAPQLGKKLLDEINKSLTTLQHLAQGNTMIKLVSWSVMAWLAEGCVFWFAGLALPSIVAPLAGWLALPVGTLATLIPTTPGYIGTFDFFTWRAMTALSNTSAAATAYALLVHALLWLPPTLVGVLYLLLHPVKQQDKLKVI
jgi:glycosyltransferase 2 family protein